MLLGIHVITASVGILSSILNIFRPSKNLFRTTYLLTFGTILSGALLTILDHTLLQKTCISGLLYSAFIILSSKIAKYRFNILFFNR